jgi:cytochrome c5
MHTRHAFAALAAAAALAFAAPGPAARAADAPPLADGKAAFEKKCGTCHGIDRSLAKQADSAGWATTIKRMVKNGAAIDEAQSGQILGYLTAKSAFELRCNTCHDLDRPLTAIKNADAWRATVNRMAAMKPGAISEADAGAITLYLSLVTPVKK